MTVVIGVDGSGRTHRLRQLAAASATPVVWFDGTTIPRDSLVIVDDAHRLGADALRALTSAARAGVPLVISRRPTVDRPELAELDEAVASSGVEVLGPLDAGAVAALVATAIGRPVSPEDAAAVFEASAGLPAVAAAIAGAPTTSPAPALLARVQRRFAVLERGIVTVARVLALRLELTDAVLAAAAGVTPDALAGAFRVLRDEGLLAGERLIPAVAGAVLAEISPAERRRLHDAVAGALVAAGADPVTSATQLRAARVFTPAAAAVYRQAGERLRFTDPAAALSWFDDAADAGDPDTEAGRAEASALLGLPVEALRLPPRLAGALAAHEGRSARAAELLLTADPPVLAVPALVGTGRLAEAKALPSNGSPALVRLAEAALAAGRPDTALPLMIEAAEAVESAPPRLVLPDTPHALGAVLAVATGDLASAEHLLTRALDATVGGPVATERHRLLLAWARMRAGRYDTALAELARTATASLNGRERLLRASIAAGIARRRGDIAGLREAWGSVEPVLARRAVDLWQAEAVEELVVAAARLRQSNRAEPVVELLEELVERLGDPPAWVAAVGWIRVQAAVAEEDAVAAARHAERLAPVAAGGRPGTLCAAARLWAEVLAGTVEPDVIMAGTEQLEAARLPWEASRLAGQAAIRTTDPAAARRLLERARELSEPDRAGPESAAEPAGLSERELAVARLVLAGSTHREIGAQLYIAPKTVEHHVARIRTKLGAESRAELVAMLREIITD